MLKTSIFQEIFNLTTLQCNRNCLSPESGVRVLLCVRKEGSEPSTWAGTELQGSCCGLSGKRAFCWHVSPRPLSSCRSKLGPCNVIGLRGWAKASAEFGQFKGKRSPTPVYLNTPISQFRCMTDPGWPALQQRLRQNWDWDDPRTKGFQSSHVLTQPTLMNLGPAFSPASSPPPALLLPSEFTLSVSSSPSLDVRIPHGPSEFICIRGRWDSSALWSWPDLCFSSISAPHS